MFSTPNVGGSNRCGLETCELLRGPVLATLALTIMARNIHDKKKNAAIQNINFVANTAWC
jgi:hypothetical protein